MSIHRINIAMLIYPPNGAGEDNRDWRNKQLRYIQAL